MLEINKLSSEIYLTRGDNGCFSLAIEKGTSIDATDYSLKKEDNIYFGIEEPNQPFEHAIVKKVLNLENNILNQSGDLVVELGPDDTICLMPGTYFYEIKAQFYRGNIYRNKYIYLVLRDDGVFLILNTEKKDTLLLTGVYKKENNIIEFETTDLKKFTVQIENGQIKIDDGSSEAYNQTYKQEKNLIETIVPKSRFIIGE